ncbi:hypothetical protein [Rhodobacter sp. 24-YEA-8]|uniref:hypothetical protein n=1 Tax=Rhodobacter sp. 24-YEA-8 TaxID=1884310 RepID=UPI000B855199|nr:hypothetical protein [Rhodobacter sp. 24-YEA-8]
MRDGQAIATPDKNKTDIAGVVTQMSGRKPVAAEARSARPVIRSGEVLMPVRGLNVPGVLNDKSFDLHRGDLRLDVYDAVGNAAWYALTELSGRQVLTATPEEIAAFIYKLQLKVILKSVAVLLPWIGLPASGQIPILTQPGIRARLDA